MIIEKDRLILQAKMLNTEMAWNVAKQAKNRTKNFIQRAKQTYISDTLETNRNNPKIFWRKINDILPNKKDKTTSKILLKNQQTQQIIDDKNIPNYINDYFFTIGPKLAQNYKTDYSFHGPIGRKVIFPDKWKEATVTPLKKEGFTNNVSGLRPISVLPIPGKIFEKLIHNQLYTYINNRKLISEFQGCFRPNYSTNSTIGQFTDYIYTNINQHKLTHSIFIDFSKAFNTINYNILFKKLELFYLKDSAIDLPKNYLTNKKTKGPGK